MANSLPNVTDRRPDSFVRSVVSALRPHQWAKNVLLVAPLLTSHEFFNPRKLTATALAIVCFCFAASGIYVLNDLVDVSADRLHPSKRDRPFASGRLEARAGYLMIAVLSVLSMLMAVAWLPSMFVLMLGCYFFVTTLYTFWLKRKMIIDVLCLAGLYTLRILAGGAAAEVIISPWLMAFSMFLFLSLAFAKRFAEIALLKDTARSSRRGYINTDLDLIRSVGPSSGTLSVLVLCLYLNSPEVLVQYQHPRRLWFLCPLLLYWILRIWFVAHRDALRDDPVLFALKDRVSWIVGMGCALVIVSASVW